MGSGGDEKAQATETRDHYTHIDTYDSFGWTKAAAQAFLKVKQWSDCRGMFINRFCKKKANFLYNFVSIPK